MRRFVRWCVAACLWLGLAPATSFASVSPPEPVTPNVASARVDRQDLLLRRWRSQWRRPVQRIAVKGLDRTHPKVVRRELTVRVGKTLTRGDLRESLTRLRNLGIFRRVDAQVALCGAERVCVTFSCDEKWSLLPIVSFGRGGGRLFFRLGAQDRNVGGRYLATQAYYWYFAGTHSGVLILSDPRLFDLRLSGSALMEHSNRNRFRYDRDGALVGAWSRQRQRLTLEVADLRDPERVYGVSMTGLRDQFGVGLLGDDLRQAAQNVYLREGLPEDGLWLVMRLWGRLGRIQRDDYLERGVEASASISGAHGWVNGDDTWLRGQAGVKAAWLGPKRLNLVARAVLSAQTRAHPEHRLFVGGYTALRGAEGRRRRQGLNNRRGYRASTGGGGRSAGGGRRAGQALRAASPSAVGFDLSCRRWSGSSAGSTSPGPFMTKIGCCRSARSSSSRSGLLSRAPQDHAVIRWRGEEVASHRPSCAGGVDEHAVEVQVCGRLVSQGPACVVTVDERPAEADGEATVAADKDAVERLNGLGRAVLPLVVASLKHRAVAGAADDHGQLSVAMDGDQALLGGEVRGSVEPSNATTDRRC